VNLLRRDMCRLVLSIKQLAPASCFSSSLDAIIQNGHLVAAMKMEKQPSRAFGHNPMESRYHEFVGHFPFTHVLGHSVAAKIPKGLHPYYTRISIVAHFSSLKLNSRNVLYCAVPSSQFIVRKRSNTPEKGTVCTPGLKIHFRRLLEKKIDSSLPVLVPLPCH
jgi:hypothetical protein